MGNAGAAFKNSLPTHMITITPITAIKRKKLICPLLDFLAMMKTIYKELVAIASISILAPFGRAETWTQARAGLFSEKYFSYTLFIRVK